jgi:hypothetical protein
VRRVLSSAIQYCAVCDRGALLSTCFHTGFLLGLFFDPEDGGDVPSKRLSTFNGLPTWRYIPEDSTLHNHYCENLKFYNLCEHASIRDNPKATLNHLAKHQLSP